MVLKSIVGDIFQSMHYYRLSRGCIYESLFLIFAVKQKFGDEDLDDESESSSSESEDEDARVS